MTTFERSLEAQSVPGTNLKGAGDEAHWYLLLPCLELGRVLALGRPSPSALTTLSKLGDEVTVWAKDRHHGQVRALVDKRGLSNVSLLTAERGTELPLSDDDVDVLLVAEPRLARSNLGDDKLSAELARVLKATGSLYVESGSALDRWSRRGGPSLPPNGGRRELLWAAPAWDEMRFAAPSGDRAAIDYLQRRFLKSPVRRELLKRPRRILARSPLLNRIVRRRVLIATGDGEIRSPPRYVEAIAAAAGVTMSGLRWAFAAPGEYSSQKALLFLFDGEEEEPGSVVKITRDARHNARLENEWRALTLMQERAIGDPVSRPTPLFFGYHGGRAVLGETALAGAPFPKRTHATPECPFAHRVVEWLLELGVTTSHPAESPAKVVAGLNALLRRFDELYRPEAATIRFLAEQVDTIGQNAERLQLVFQHGDPGPWNVLVSPTGVPGFLDWEAADPDGMPLWDLVHFLRSFALSVSQKVGRRDPLGSFAEQILADSALNRLLVETTHRFCLGTGLSPVLVEPLFHLCWAHRAVKEASRLPAEKLRSGRYFNLVRLSVQHRDAPGLRRLFSLQAAS